MSSSREKPNMSNKNDVVNSLFLSSVDTCSIQSTSSHSDKINKQTCEKTKSEVETSFAILQNFSDNEKRLKASLDSHITNKKSITNVNNLQEYHSGDSEDHSTSISKKIVSLPAETNDFKSLKENQTAGDSGQENVLKSVLEKNKRSYTFHEASRNKNERNLIQKETSYTDKIRYQSNTIKESAEFSSIPQIQSKFKVFSPKLKRTKVNEFLRQEEREVITALERHEKVKGLWQQAFKASLDSKRKTAEECNFFFVSEEQVSSIESHLEESPSKDSTISNQGELKILASELLNIREDWTLVEFVKPKMSSIKNKKLWEEKLFLPSRNVSGENIIESGLKFRQAERDGLFIKPHIKIPKEIKQKMKQRILTLPDGKKWFEKNELILTRCPFKPVSTRPYLIDRLSNFSWQLEFNTARPLQPSNCLISFPENINCVLEIDLNSIQFSHHPLFSREHVLAQRLRELYIKYKKRKETDSLNRLSGKLNALRTTRDNLEDIINAGGDNANLREKLLKYKNDIKEIRQLRYDEGKAEKELAHKILMTWKDLTKLREEQGFQNTDLKLNIQKKNTENFSKEKLKWEEDINQEIGELLDELKQKCKKKLEEFNKTLEHKPPSKKRKEETVDSNVSTENTSQIGSSDELGSERKKMKINSEVSVSEIANLADTRAQVLEKFKKCFRQPGEPELEFRLSKTLVQDIPANNKEQLRRTSAKRCLIFLKLFYNDKEICRSKSQPLNQNFNVSISQRFAIQIFEKPESLMIEIHENTGALNKKLLVPGIYLPFPDSFTTIKTADFIKHEFSSKSSVTFHHSAVGAGHKLIPCPGGSDVNNQPVFVYTAGYLICRLGWMEDGGKILAPPEKYSSSNIRKENFTNISEILKSEDFFNVLKLNEWAKNSKLDPNDPHNSAFFYFLKSAKNLEAVTSYFRLNPLLTEFDFCTNNDIEGNIRLKLLKLRDAGEPEFKDLKGIPLREKKIHREIFLNYEKRILMPDSSKYVSCSEPLEGHRNWGRKYLEQIQQKLLKMSRTSKKKKRFQDIVLEETVPDLGTLGSTFMKWLRPKRPLHPIRKERKKITPQNLNGHGVNLVVNVVRAFEVPVRKEITSSSNDNIEEFSLVNVRPFVEISFRGIRVRTTTAEGANPTWNQDLKIPLTGNLHLVNDILYLHLFDETVIDLIEDESARETNIHQRLERNWLASMEIPFSALYFNSRIEGTFKLYSPPILLGYEREAHRQYFRGVTKPESLLHQRDATYITLFITVQPALSPPRPLIEKMEGNETSILENHLENWKMEIYKMFPHRKIKTLVLHVTGKSVCITRYIKPFPPPPINEENKISPEMIARFVALIPFVQDSSMFPEFFDICLTNDQVLKFLCGDSEDHAILLCSYLLHVGLEAYLLLGSGIPHGFTAYVLVKEQINKKNEYFVWDPISGQKYNINDSFCPLQKVHCLINKHNIWANIQTEEMIRRTRFDLTKRMDWFPAFGKNFAAPIDSIQPQTLHYQKTSKEAVELLQEKIEKKLRDNIMKWRKKSRTHWNRYCAAILRKLLPKLEEASWDSSDEKPNHNNELQHILASHKMCGFPINMPYTNIQAVTEAVRATGVHCNENEGVEFAVAVYIHAYPNDILSVWIYVTSLLRKR